MNAKRLSLRKSSAKPLQWQSFVFVLTCWKYCGVQVISAAFLIYFNSLFLEDLEADGNCKTP
jgi:hypothetical protein